MGPHGMEKFPQSEGNIPVTRQPMKREETFAICTHDRGLASTQRIQTNKLGKQPNKPNKMNRVPKR